MARRRARSWYKSASFCRAGGNTNELRFFYLHCGIDAGLAMPSSRRGRPRAAMKLGLYTVMAAPENRNLELTAPPVLIPALPCGGPAP